MALLLYISIRLMMRVSIDVATNITVWANMTESPRPNQAVSEKGIYMLRNTTANNTEKVTVPMSWYFPSRYPGILSFKNMVFGFSMRQI